MSSERTGFAHGRLKPAIYFERSDGFVILAPAEKGRDDYARMVYETKYGPAGWQWREADTLPDVDRLEKRLIEQEEARIMKMVTLNAMARDEIRTHVRARLVENMHSPHATQFERQFIDAYLKLHDNRRDKYRDRLLHHNLGLMARNYDSGTKVEDLL